MSYFLNLEITPQTAVSEPGRGAGWTWCVWSEKGKQKGAWFWAEQITSAPYRNEIR